MEHKLETIKKVISEMLVSKLEYLEERNKNEESILKACHINKDIIKKGLKELAAINTRITTEKVDKKYNTSVDARKVSRDKKAAPSTTKSVSKGPTSKNKSSKRLSPSNASEYSKKTNFTTIKTTKGVDTGNISLNDSTVGQSTKPNDGRSKSKGKTLVKNNTVSNSKSIFDSFNFSSNFRDFSKEDSWKAANEKRRRY